MATEFQKTTGAPLDLPQWTGEVFNFEDVNLALHSVNKFAEEANKAIDSQNENAQAQQEAILALFKDISNSLVPPGAIEMFAMQSPPAGWLKANGAAVSRTDYADLFAAVGTTYGAGDGGATFLLPDLRGEFLRGWDNGRGVDTGRVFGISQAQSIGTHAHSFSMYVSGTTYQMPYAGLPGTTSPTSRLGISGLKAGYDGVSAPLAIGDVIGDSGENRPRNIALLACIKY